MLNKEKLKGIIFIGADLVGRTTLIENMVKAHGLDDVIIVTAEDLKNTVSPNDTGDSFDNFDRDIAMMQIMKSMEELKAMEYDKRVIDDWDKQDFKDRKNHFIYNGTSNIFRPKRPQQVRIRTSLPRKIRL